MSEIYTVIVVILGILAVSGLFDIPVHATVEGLHTGCDEILEKALEMVRTGEYDPAAEK